MNNSLTNAKRAEYRSSLYKLLSIVFLQEPISEMLSVLKKTNIIKGPITKKFLDALIVEFNRLFYGPGKHCSPNESVYREGEGSLWGAATVKVKKYVESLGLKYHVNWRGMPDHISVELELMQMLVDKEKEGWEEGDKTAVHTCLQYQSGFISEHLMQWVPAFCADVKKTSKIEFYRCMADVTKEFIKHEGKHVDMLLQKINSRSQNSVVKKLPSSP